MNAPTRRKDERHESACAESSSLVTGPLVRSTPLYLLTYNVDDIQDLFESVRRQGFESLAGVS